MKYLKIFIIIFIGCSCKSNPHHYKVKAIDMDTVRYAKYPYIATENNIQKLVNCINTSDCVYFGRIGFAGEENEVYDSYQRLLDIAPDSIWIKLSYNKNSVLRIYAFKALETKKSSRLQEVKDRLQKDKATICYVSADISATYSVGRFVSSAK